jgi:hypothetical protein
MKKMFFAIGAAAVVALAALSAPAQAQPHHGDRGYRPHVVVVPPPPPRHITRHGYHPVMTTMRTIAMTAVLTTVMRAGTATAMACLTATTAAQTIRIVAEFDSGRRRSRWLTCPRAAFTCWRATARRPS